MARPKGSFKVPSYRLHKPSGQAVTTVRGKDRYLGPYGSESSREEYVRLIGEWSHTGTVASGGELTVNELIAGYWSHMLKSKPSGAIKGRIKAAGRVLRKLYGDTPAAKFGPLAYKIVRDELIKTPVTNYRPSKGVSVAGDKPLALMTVNHYMSTVRLMFKWAASNEMISPSVLHGILTVPPLRPGDHSGARETDKVLPVPEEDMEAVLAKLRPQPRAIMNLLLLTGARATEICTLRTSDIDMSGEVWKYRPAKHKTQRHGIERVIQFGPRGQEVLRPFLRADLQAYIFKPEDSKPDGTGNRRGNHTRRHVERYTTSSLIGALRSAAIRVDRERKANGTFKGPCRWHTHQLRHNAAHRLQEMFDGETAQHALGHTTRTMTARYAGPDIKRVERAMAEVG